MIGKSGDSFVHAISGLAGNLPVFGSLPISDDSGFANSYVLYDGEALPDAVALAGFYGDVDPCFFTIDVGEESVLRTDATITAADKNVVLEINGIPAADYIESIDLATEGNLDHLVSTPFVLECKNGARLVRACFSDDGGKGAVLGGDAPVGARLGFAVTEPGDIVKTASLAMAHAKDYLIGLRERGAARPGAALMYSCAGRSWSLGVEDMAEHEEIAASLPDDFPFFMAYSGGELYPQKSEDGPVINTMQNHSLVICIL